MAVPFPGAVDVVDADSGDIDILILSDSTGESYNEWPGELAQLLATRYSAYSVEWEAYWNSGSEDWLDTRTVSTGSGSNTIKFWVLGGGGWHADDAIGAGKHDHPTNVDHIVLSIGVNGTTESEWDTCISALQSQWPSARYTMVAQNAVASNSYLPGSQQQESRDSAARYGMGVSDFEAHHIATGDPASYLSDGVHPNASGSELWAEFMESEWLKGSIVGWADRAELWLDARQYGGSGDWLDGSGNGHNGVITGATFLGRGTLGKYVWTPKTADNHLYVENVAVPAASTSYDIVALCYADDWTDAYPRIYSLSNYELSVNPGAVVEMKVSGLSGSKTKNSTTALPATDGEWLWVKGSFDPVANEFTFWYSTDVGLARSDVSWTQLGAAVAGGGTTEATASLPATTDHYIGVQNGGSLQPWGGGIQCVAVVADGSDVLDVNLNDALEPFATFTERVSNATVTIKRSVSGYVSTVVDRDMFVFSTDDSIQVADHANLDFADADDFTLVTALRLHGAAAAGQRVAAKRNANGYHIELTPLGGNLGARMFLDGATTSTNTDGAEVADYTATVWAGRRDASATPQVFTDGAPGTAGTDSTGTLADSTPFYIGSQLGAANYFEGQVFAVALFREALTDTEIANLSNELAGIPTNAVTVAGPGQVLMTG